MTTNDLVKRARNFAHLEDTDAHCLVEELADEIERLETHYKAEYEIVDRIWKVLGIETFEDAKGREISEIVQDKLDEIERLREALKRQLRHTLNSDLPRAPQDYNFGKRALEGE